MLITKEPAHSSRRGRPDAAEGVHAADRSRLVEGLTKAFKRKLTTRGCSKLSISYTRRWPRTWARRLSSHPGGIIATPLGLIRTNHNAIHSRQRLGEQAVWVGSYGSADRDRTLDRYGFVRGIGRAIGGAADADAPAGRRAVAMGGGG